MTMEMQLIDFLMYLFAAFIYGFLIGIAAIGWSEDVSNE